MKCGLRNTTETIRLRRQRRGTTMVEMAIVLPLFIFFFFAAIEFCRVAMIRHTADNAVYEACRVGIIPGGQTDDVKAEARRILNSLGIAKADIKVSPDRIKRDTADVTVRVEVPLDDNTFVPNQFVSGRKIVRELTLQRESAR